VHYQEFVPGAELRPYVRAYWKLKGAGGAPQDIFPDGSMEAVFHFGEPFAGQGRALLVGQMLEATRVRPGGRVEAWGVRFRAGGVSAFLDVPQTELTNRITGLADVWPSLARAFEARRFDEVDRALRDGLRVRRDERVLQVLGALDSEPGLSLDELATASNMSARHFRRRALQAAGVGPKTLARLARFRTALRISESVRTLAHLAVEAGYADHAHMVRDFRQFAGAPPTETVCSLTGITRVFVRFSQDAGAESGLC